jgi:hypothetical protein
MARTEGKGQRSTDFLTVAGISLLFWNYTRIRNDSGQALFLLVLVSLAFVSRLLAERGQFTTCVCSTLSMPG